MIGVAWAATAVAVEPAPPEQELLAVLLLEPAEAEAMAVVAGDHVVAAVAVDVVDIHLPAATGSRGAERAGSTCS